jgi:hypothetical protein
LNFAAECDRWRISDREAAALSSALLQDLGYITQNDKSCVLDRRRERRERHFVFTIQSSNEFFGLYFDGKKIKPEKLKITMVLTIHALK